MGFMDILERYAQGVESGSPAAVANVDTPAHFDSVAAAASPQDLGSGIAAALKNGAGGVSFASSVEQLFGNSNPQQRAGVLAQLANAVEPAVLSSIAGGALTKFLPGAGGGAPTPSDADAISPAQAGELAAAAQQRDPSVIDRVGTFYAQHPTVVKALGVAALAMAMSHMAQRAGP